LALQPSAKVIGANLAAAAADAADDPSVGQVGLYDQAGVFRFAGEAEADCLAYAALFELPLGSFSLAPLGGARLGLGLNPASSS